MNWFINTCLAPYKYIVIAVVAVLVLIFVIVAVKSCGRSSVKLNEPEIQKGEQAIQERDDAKLTTTLAESDVRTQKALDTMNAADTETQEAIQQAKQKYEDWTPEQKAAEFERRKNQ